MRAPFLTIWLGIAASLSSAEPKPPEVGAPRFNGHALPTPPQQGAAWNPGHGIVPEKWIDAARTLFQQGLADPRGCEYREIEVVVGSVWGGSGAVVKTHGWVLPREPAWTQDFAVCWNGLVYPVVKTGAPADFRADAQAGGGEKEKGRSFGSSEDQRVRGNTEGSVAGSAKLPIKACLLLRLGEDTLARAATLEVMRRERDFWAPVQEKTAVEAGKPVPPREEPTLDPKEDPYLDWAQHWAWSLWDRAVCAHMRGDDGLALATLRQLATVNPAIRQEADRRGLKTKTVFDANERFDGWHFLNWLREPFSKLLADQERRAKLPERPTVVEAGAAKYPDKSARIAALVEDLQEVSVRQWGQPGGLEPYSGDPIVKALTAEDADAVEPLLRAWEHDGGRLTRSISFGRDFHPGRNLHTVAGPIVATLAGIMKVSPDDLRALVGGATPGTVRDYWRKAEGKMPVERWYLTMADDQAGVKAWQQAAKEIVRPNNERNLGNGTIQITPLKPGEVAAMAGEPLRAKANPSLTELWVKRAAQIRPSDEHVRQHVFDLTYSCEFVAHLARWDRAAAVKEAALHMDLCRRHIVGHWGMAVADGSRFVDFVARFALVRADAGDLAGLEDYCAWLANAKNTPEGEPFHPNHWMGWEAREGMRLFEPLWRYAQNPSVKTTVSVIFAGPNSFAGPLFKTSDRNDSPLAEIVKTPMLRFADVRTYVLAALANHAEMGEAEVRADGYRKVGNGTAKGPPPLPGAAVDQKVKYRTCDFYAWQLSRWEGLPAVELTWPEEKRDAAVAECIRLLKDNGKLFEENKPRKLPGDWPSFGSREW